MMAYATTDDMIRQLGEREVLSLADRDADGQPDPGVLEGALDAATAEINVYLAERYSLPLATAYPILTTYCVDIARYRLLGAQTTETEPARVRYRDAIRFLELVAQGKVSLGANPDGSAAVQQKQIGVVGSRRVFTRCTLQDFVKPC